jgi:hypothetical protein
LSPTFIIQKVLKFYTETYYKPNGGINVFKMKHKMFLNLLSYVYVKNCHMFK